MTISERERARRNLNPHAEARMAMVLWSYEYAHKQRGGSMDFWDTRTDSQKRLCKDSVDDILNANETNGRADDMIRATATE